MQWGLLLLSILFTYGCAHNAREFINGRLQVEFPENVNLCPGGTMKNDDSCKPSSTGGAEWVWNDKFGIVGIEDNSGGICFGGGVSFPSWSLTPNIMINVAAL